MAVTEHIPVPLRLNVLRSVSKLRLTPALEASLEDKIGDVELAHRRRNALVHYQWAYDKTLKRYVAIGDIEALPELKPKTIAEIKEDAEFIYDSGMGLMTFLIMADLLPSARHHATTRP
jgi:hypothetical protein